MKIFHGVILRTQKSFKKSMKGKGILLSHIRIRADRLKKGSIKVIRTDSRLGVVLHAPEVTFHSFAIKGFVINYTGRFKKKTLHFRFKTSLDWNQNDKMNVDIKNVKRSHQQPSLICTTIPQNKLKIRLAEIIKSAILHNNGSRR